MYIVKKIIRSTLVLVVIVFFTFIFIREISKLNHINNENRQVLDRIEKLKAENKTARDEIEVIKTDTRYVEKLIREELGMIKTTEKIYKFDN